MQERFTPLRSDSANLLSIGHPYDGREDTFIMGAGAALLAAAAGARIVLHGAGRVPSKHAPGVGDVLQALGLPTHLGPADASGFLSAHGFVHVDTRQFMPAWNGQLEIREKIGLRLPFSSAEKLLDPPLCRNILGGIAHGPYLAKMTGALQHLKIPRGLIVQGLEGSCDISPQHATRVAEVSGETVTELNIDPKALGISPALEVRTVGADPQVCAALTRDAFELKSDDRSRGAAEALALNAALLLWRAGISSDVPSGLEKARSTLKSGAAAELLAAPKS
jgi:anthranilate phosphoribosyltransferase